MHINYESHEQKARLWLKNILHWMHMFFVNRAVQVEDRSFNPNMAHSVESVVAGLENVRRGDCSTNFAQSDTQQNALSTLLPAEDPWAQ